MKPQSKTPGGTDTRPGARHAETGSQKKTPSTEVQMEDAGTPDSGNTGLGGRGGANEGAMKQRSRMSRERGVPR